MPKQYHYVSEPQNKIGFTKKYDRFYSLFAGVYDISTKIFPFWRRWLNTALPHIQGPRVLEVSFGTGALLNQYAANYQTYGIDYNEKFVVMLHKKLKKLHISADIRQGDVQALPYQDHFFDTVVNTMAFTAYPDGLKAMSEMHRVLKPGGKLIMVDIAYPHNRRALGMALTNAWIAMGDIVRDMAPIFEEFNFDFSDQQIGGFGSVHLFVAQKH